MKKKLSLSCKLSRLRARLRDAEWRRYGVLLLAGKLAGIGIARVRLSRQIRLVQNLIAAETREGEDDK